MIHTVFHLFFVKLHFWFDLIGSELTILDILGKADIVDYSAICARMDATSENLRFKIHFQIDFNECLLGLLGFTILDPLDCYFSSYFLTSPLVDVGVSEFDKKW